MKTKFCWLFLFLLILTGLANATQLSGTYTIDPSQSASTSNFKDIKSAVTYLINNSTRTDGGPSNSSPYGVSGPVIFQIAAGTYTLPIRIPSITGASSTNTITFQSVSGLASDTKIQCDASAGNEYTIQLYGADWITIKNLGIIHTGAYGTTPVLLDSASTDQCENISILNCTIQCGSNTNTSYNGSGIYVACRGNNILLKGNTITKGISGISFASVWTDHTNIEVDSNFVGTSSSNSPTVLGILVSQSTNVKITRNVLNGSLGIIYTGIEAYWCSGTIEISYNTVLAPGSTVNTYGIFVSKANWSRTGSVKVYNNAVTAKNIGLFIYLSYDVLSYNNSIYSGGRAVGIIASGSLMCNGTKLINNSFVSSGAQAFYIYSDSGFTGTVGMMSYCNYNNFYSATGTLATVAYGSTNVNYTSLSAFKGILYTGSDSKSLSSNVSYTSSSNLQASVSSANSWALNGTGTCLSYNSSDIRAASRSTSPATGAPDIGAYEFTPQTSVNPTCSITGSHTAGGTENIFFFGRQIASLTWDTASGSLPGITPKFYSGTWPDTANVNAPSNSLFFNSYLSISASGGSGYTYSISLYYDPAQIGGVSSESNIRLSKRSGSGNPWSYYSSSSVNTSSQTVTGTGFTSFSEFTGTDNNNPLLPVTWLQFKGEVQGEHALLNWATASEKNNAGFELQRSEDGKLFTPLTFVSGQGTSNSVQHYFFTDQNAFSQYPAFYYRLKQTDFNGTFTYSETIYLKKESLNKWTVYPNPFNEWLMVEGDLSSPAELTITDVFGRTVHQQIIDASNRFVSGLDLIPDAVYIATLKQAGQIATRQLVKSR